jgi:hypothetical protein
VSARPYRYATPAGWTARPSPNGRLDDAIYLRGPADMPRAAILLLRPVPKVRSHADELATQLTTGTADGEVLDRSPVSQHRMRLPALVQSAVLRIQRGSAAPHEERRIFAVLEAPEQFLPSMLIAEPSFVFFHEPAFLQLLGSLEIVAEVPAVID